MCFNENDISTNNKFPPIISLLSWKTPLLSLQSSVCNRPNISGVNHPMQSVVSLAHLQHQLIVAELLESTTEFFQWYSLFNCWHFTWIIWIILKQASSACASLVCDWGWNETLTNIWISGDKVPCEINTLTFLFFCFVSMFHPCWAMFKVIYHFSLSLEHSPR